MMSNAVCEAERLAKNDLQEVIQRLYPHRPVGSIVAYDTTSVNGLFVSKCTLFGLSHEGVARVTKKDAEKSAALVALEAYRKDPQRYRLTTSTGEAPVPTVAATITTSASVRTVPHVAPPKPSPEASALTDLRTCLSRKYPTVPVCEMLGFKTRDALGGLYVAECSVLGVEYTGDPRRSAAEAESSAAYIALIDFRDAFPEESSDPTPLPERVLQEAALRYDEVVAIPSHDLPKGWVRMQRPDGTIVYLDHLSREGYYEAPWDVWQRKHTAFIVQAVTKVGRMK